MACQLLWVSVNPNSRARYTIRSRHRRSAIAWLTRPFLRESEWVDHANEASGPTPDAGPDPALEPLRKLTSTLVHEVRTPLSALAGEVELALRRDRSPAAYRQALSRIAEHTADLIELTSDLALLAGCEQPRVRSQAADLDVVASHLSKRYAPGQIEVAIDPQPGPVAGDERLLIHALRLVLDHALRHRDSGSPVRLRSATPAIAANVGVDLIVDAVSPGVARHTWEPLTIDDYPDRGFNQGLVRVRAASQLVRAFGGSITADDIGEGAARLRIHLCFSSAGLDTHRPDAP